MSKHWTPDDYDEILRWNESMQREARIQHSIQGQEEKAKLEALGKEFEERIARIGTHTRSEEN